MVILGEPGSHLRLTVELAPWPALAAVPPASRGPFISLFNVLHHLNEDYLQCDGIIKTFVTIQIPVVPKDTFTE
jgi:hypothetical protein